MNRPDVSVVIVSHDHAPYLDACLRSVAPGRHRVSHEVFVVNNLSHDDTARIVREEYAWVQLIENKSVAGLAANNNRPIRMSKGRYVLILNPDTEVSTGALEQLVEFMDAQPSVGICGPKLVYPDGRIQPSCRRFPTLAVAIARRTPLRKFMRHALLNARHLMDDFDHTYTRPVDWVLGACLLVRREFLSEVGLMDEGFFLYVEDIDWCYRAWQAGWEVMYFPGACVVHYHLAKSDRALLSKYSWYHLQSMWRYYRKHLAPYWLRLKVTEELIR